MNNLQKNKDTIFLERCFELAQKGLGTTYPNPLVGAVIVHNNKIIGEGFHHQSGKNHAEIVAIQSVKNKELLSESTLYCNLEPCSHVGKTPACSHAIVAHNIKKVVIAGKDFHDKVNGKGIEYLRKNNVEVVENEQFNQKNIELNKRFFTHHTQQRPYIILKFAETKNGFIDDNSTLPLQITNSYSKQLNHQFRTEEQAILIGKNTAIKDNPKLNARFWKGTTNYKIIIDRKLEVPKTHEIFKQEKVIIINEVIDEEKGNVNYKIVDFQEDIIPQILNLLYNLEIQSVIIEGGSYTIQQFLDAEIWDEARIFQAPKTIEKGIKSPIITKELHHQMSLGSDVLKYYYNV